MVLAQPVFSQNFTAQKAYQDYLYTLDQYNQSYSNYEQARSFYLKNPTLTLKEDARRATYSMLTSRDELIKTYLTALRIKTLETKGLEDGDKNTIFSKIDPEVTWYKDHKDSYKQTDSLEDLLSKSKETDSRYKNQTETIAYDSLFNISYGEIVDLRKNHEEIYVNLKSFIGQEANSNQADLSLFDRWFSDIDSSLNETKDIEGKAKDFEAKFYSENYRAPKNTFKSAIEVLSPAINSVKKTNNFLKELTTSIQGQI